MERLCSSSSSNRKNPNKNKEIMVSARNEKPLRDWKLPPFPASYALNPSGCCSLITSVVKTVEKKISLSEGYTIIPLLSEHRRIAYLKRRDLLEVGMIQVGLKPRKLGSNTSAIICVRDKRRPKYHDSIIGMAASSLRDGPIYFSCLPNPHYLVLSNWCDAFNIDVKIEGSSLMGGGGGGGGDGNITLMFRFHYRLNTVEKINKGCGKLSKPDPVDEKGKTTLYLTNIAQRNSVASKTISWGGAEVGEGLMVANSNLLSGGGAVGGADVDWKETAKAHVLKVDAPGFKKEEVRVSVDEGGGILLISGERSNAEEEEEAEIEKWHCEERRGKFLRRLRLPETARLDGLKPGMENGVLTVTVPKKEVETKKKPELKIIDISG